jgi:imidazolonepropionase-like amidohydrolase
MLIPILGSFASPIRNLPMRFCTVVRWSLLAALAAGPAFAQRPNRPMAEPEGPKAQVLRPTVFAIRDARVVVEAGRVLPKATVVVRDGIIEAVGPDVTAPADALAIDGAGLTVYPGFIDALSTWGYDPALRRSEGGPAAPEDFASESLAATQADNRKGLTPEFQVRTALKADDEQAEAWRKAGFTAHLVSPEGGFFSGQSALVSLSDAPPREAVLRAPIAQHAAFRSVGGPGAGSEYPRALMGIFAHCRQTLIDAGHHRRLHDAFEKRGGTGKRPPLDPTLEALGLILLRKQEVVFEADTADQIERALSFATEFNLRPVIYGGRDAWKVADRLKELNVPVLLRLAFTEPDKEREADLPARVKADRDRKRQEEVRCAAELSKKGVRFAISTQGLAADKFRENLRQAITAGLPADAALKALTADAAELFQVAGQLGTVAKGRAAHLTVTDGDFQAEKTQVRYVFADGVRFAYEKGKADDKKPGEGRPGDRRPGGERAAEKPADKPEDKPAAEKKPDDKPVEKKVEVASELEPDRKPKTHTGGNVLIRNATVITVSGATLTKADILVRGGKIVGIGKDFAAPDGVSVIDATGMFVMPGIIDTHSHFAISGGVNEFSLSVVPEVRVRDLIDSEDVEIFRAAAGGVTTARLLHGSANVIGGQDAVIKLKYGRPARELLLAEAPRGVKFALGENVKRTDGRFPNTRLGVEAVLVRSFTEAQAYQRAWDEYRQRKADDPGAVEPRRDLRLEALADILRGDLKVHCHCYRADEILMLLRVADRFGFKVQSLQHVLEGYKIAPEIAAHGASCSLFSDWWAYKIEAYDAIPYAAALLNEAGASVCLKSDSNELMRHLYQEAAKCIKYGGMSEAEAFKTITLNPAKQLGLQNRIGTIEPGKDADLAIFNGHPLNSYAACEMTLIDGEVFFQRSDKLTPLKVASASPAKPVDGFKAIPRNPEGSYVLRGVTVHDGEGKVSKPGSVLIAAGKVTPLDNGPPPGATVIDAAGLHLYPGMIDAATVLGLAELESAKETNDFKEGGDFQPDLRASVGINPDSELIPVTRANGVTTVVTRPTGSLIAGQGALINLSGWTPREMTVVDPLSLNVELPSEPRFLRGFGTEPPPFGRGMAKKQREEKIRRLKELFAQAIAYDEGRKAAPNRPANPRLEALVPYARGQKPVVIQANRLPEIKEALKLAEELKLKVVLSGAIDSWKVADELKAKNIPVILGPVMELPSETHDPFDAPYAAAAKLHQAGVKFCIRSAGSSNTRNLPYEAAMAAAYGLPPEEALKAVTLYPAQILGVDDQFGTIASGKRANLVLTNGDLLQAATQVLAVFIDGKPFEPASKQTRLYERYRERLKEVKEGRSPLGTK